jgi:transcriptional regulator with XRE-family HTH domain
MKESDIQPGYVYHIKDLHFKVAETLGVSRQAVSKWENGTSDPSTSNLIALAKLFEISAEELVKQIVGETIIMLTLVADVQGKIGRIAVVALAFPWYTLRKWQAAETVDGGFISAKGARRLRGNCPEVPR